MTKKKTSNKNIVKSNHSKLSNGTTYDNNVSGGVKIVLCVLVLFGLFYLITVVILNKKSPYNIVNNSLIQYSEILVGEVLNQQQDDYLVLFYDKSSDDADKYSEMISNYKENNSKKSIYVVDLSEGFNKKYIDSNTNILDINDISDLRVDGVVLLHVKGGKIVDYVKDNIDEYLNSK